MSGTTGIDATDPEGDLSSLRGELAAAIAIAAAVLLGSGYLVTMAHLYNVNLPVAPVLAALPTTFYIGEALHLLLPLGVVAIPVALLCWATRGLSGFVSSAEESDETRRRYYWPFIGVSAAILFWLFDVFVRNGGVGRSKSGYPLALLAVAAIVAVSAWMLGSWGRGRLTSRKRTRGDGLKLGVAVIVLISVLAASLVRACNAAFLADPLSAVFVSAKQDVCPLLPESARRCYFHGYYLGESAQWMFLLQTPNVRQDSNLRGDRLVLIPRDEIEQAILAEHLMSLPYPSAAGPAYGTGSSGLSHPPEGGDAGGHLAIH